jgi:hypothetical protein
LFIKSFPDALMLHLAMMWNKSSTAQYLVCNHNPKQMLDDFDFALVYMDIKVPCTMHGSGEGKTFYFYQRRKKPEKGKKPTVLTRNNVTLVTADEIESLTSVSRESRLEAIQQTLDEFMNEPKAKRERKVKRYTA